MKKTVDEILIIDDPSLMNRYCIISKCWGQI